MDNLIQRAIELAGQKKTPYYPIKQRLAYMVSHGQSYASNGYAIRTQTMAETLNQNGIDTFCFVRPGRPWELNDSVDCDYQVTVDGVRYFHSPWLNTAPDNEQAHLKASVERFVELFQIYRPASVLAASDYRIGLPAWVAAMQLGLPFYNEVRGFWELSKDAREPGYASSEQGKKEGERNTFVAKQAAKVFTLNQPMVDELIARGVTAENLSIVPNGVNTLPTLREPSAALKAALGIKTHDKVIGYIGSMGAYEGLETLIGACQQLVDQGENIKLLLVGDEQAITPSTTADKSHNEKSWLIQMGRVPHDTVPDYYALLDAVVIPRKPLPVSQLVPPMKATEALAYGKRLVVSDVAPLAEYADKYESVVSFKAGNIESLVASLQRSLKKAASTPSTDFLLSANIETMEKALKEKRARGSETNVDTDVTLFQPQSDIVTKLDMSEIKKERVSAITTYTFPVSGQRLVLEFQIASEESYAHKRAIVGIEIRDSKSSLLNSESFRLFDYGQSERYGSYKYLSANSGGAKYMLTIDVPEGASQCVMRLGDRNGARVSVISEPAVSFYTGALGSEITYSLMGAANLSSPEEVELILKKSGFNVSYVTEVSQAIEVQPMDTKLAADTFWYLWRITNDPALFEMARARLVFQGRMYDTKRLLNEWDASVKFNNGKNSARRVEDEIGLLEHGMPMPERRSSSFYAPTENVLYLLHNRLPYNSGGYATRTHGLLTGIVKNSGFNMHGVSRPGYPADHAKHISKPLPKNIPRVDVVDGIEYFALDQKIRRSSLTMTEYVEAYAKEIEALAIEKKARIIHAAANFPNGLAASLAARRLGIKSVYEVRGLWEITRLSRQEGWDETDQFRFMAKMEAEACNAADAVITITEALKDLMVSRGVDASKITVAPNCVHTDLFSPLEKDQELAKELGISDKDIVIGYIGSIVNYEGLDDLLDALALLIQDNVTNFKFLLVGDGAVLDELKQQVVELGLHDYVVITGRVPHEEVQRYYSLVDITPFPRKPYLVCEAVSPLKPFEAMASQKAVIVSSCAALTEIIEDGYNGLVFNKGCVTSFKNKLADLILDKSLRSKLSRNGRKWVVGNRDWKNSALIVADAYRKAEIYD
ncbi:glycosyltransferase [Salinivibrio kushneri]|uniref:glycosyltransferase n=1 Tax=Salinivibrio kushneri TaxID=1908198 RepID=UPI0022B531E2|nr:glycosyltransferase [Salinivibrio kushneri]WBA10855.1 glycosyltransferase [Salinivibrio kushneri]